MTGINEIEQKEVSWTFSLNMVTMFSCFVLHIFSNFSRLVYSSVGFVRITVDVCNPQNCTKVKFVFLCSFETEFCGLFPNCKLSNFKKCYFLFTSPFYNCIAHSNKCSLFFSNFITVTLIHSLSVKLSVNIRLPIWVTELL